MARRPMRTRTCDCGREVKRLWRVAEEPYRACGECVRSKGLTRVKAPVYRSRARRLDDSLGTIRTAVENGEEADIGEIEDLAEEMTSWRDNMSGTGLENTEKYYSVEEAADALESGKDELESALESYNDKANETFGGKECPHCEGECPSGPQGSGECEDDCDVCEEEALEEVKNEVEGALGELEGVDFPGMY